MPAHNEAEYLPPAVHTVVAGLAQRGDGFEVLVVENGSSDETWAVAQRLAETYPEVRTHRLDRADYGAALRAGFLGSVGDIVVNFDVDFVDLDFLQTAVSALRSGPVAMVVGSKRNPGSQDRRAPARRLVTATFSLALRYGFGLGISDTHGLKAMRRQAVADLVEQCRFGQDIFDTELIIRAERAGLAVMEVPVRVSDTRPPRTALMQRIPRTLTGLVRLWATLRSEQATATGTRR